MTRTIVVAVAAVLALALTPIPGQAGSSLAGKAYKLAKQSDKRAKSADRTARKANRRALAALDREPPPGATGGAGLTGSQGAQGAKGDAGAQGADGQDATASVKAFSEINSADVDLWTPANSTAQVTVAQVDVSADGAVIVQADLQITETEGMPTPAHCWLERLGVASDHREFDVAARQKVNAALSGKLFVSGVETVKLRCGRTSGASDAKLLVPAQRARITVLAG